MRKIFSAVLLIPVFFTVILFWKSDANQASAQTRKGTGNKLGVVCSTGSNRLVNGDAEGDPGATGDGTIDHDVSSWDNEAGQFTVTRYTTGGGFPTGSSPGPAGRGSFFFSGGQATPSTGSQTISVSDCATEIDSGAFRFSLSGFLGGFEIQEDNAQLTATFKDAMNATVGTATIGPVTAADRGTVTGLLSRSASGTIPVGTRTVEFVLTPTKVSPDGTYNDGYADNLNFRVLSSQFNARDEFALTQGGTTGLWNYGYSNSDTDNTFTQFTESDTTLPCGSVTLERWFRSGEPFSLPSILRNPGTMTESCFNYQMPPQMLNLQPSQSGRRSVLRFTAPASGTFDLNGEFRGLDTRNPTGTVKIIKNATSASEQILFNTNINAFNEQQPFNFTVTAAAGDTLDFSVGNGGNGEFADSIGLSLTINQLIPSAADATISGRVTTAAGRGIKGARVLMTEQDGTVRTALTSSFGYYSFGQVAVGQTIILQVSAKRYTFADRVISVTDDLSDVTFMAEQ